MLVKSYAKLMFVAFLCSLIPIWMGHFLSQRESFSAQSSNLHGLARDLARRTDETTQQMLSVVSQLNSGRFGAKGSDGEIERMRYLSLTSTYLQSVGRMVGNRLVSTSMGHLSPAVDLGPPTIVTANNVHIWPYLKLDFAGGATFHAIEKDGVVSFITPDLIFDVFSDESAVSMGIVTGTKRLPITVHGTVDPEWAARLGNANRATFVEGGTIVALERCQVADVIAIVAQPGSQASWRLFRTSLLFMSLGGLIGVALMAAAVRSVRSYNTFPTLLRRAVAERQFFLVLQPIVDLSNSQIVGAEALIRWRKPNGEVMSPAVFVPMAQEANLMPEITNQVIDMALPAAKALIETNGKFYLAINLTSEDIRSGRIPPRLRNLAAQHGVPLRNLGVEVTESGLLSGPEDMRCLDEFRDMGVRIAMDDFGTGYSSLAYLMNIHIDVLKIDKIFVDAIGTEAATSSVISHMIRMAKELHLPIVAEGVETEEQAAFLRENGVQYAQGYYFGKPIELEQFLAMLMERSRTATPV